MNYKKIIKLLLITVLLNAAFSVSAQAQKRLSDIEYAQRLEHAQEYERALAIYTRLYDRGNKNYEVAGGIIRCYYGLRQYQELIKFLTTLSKQYPRRFDYKIDLGRAYYMNNQKGKALQIWNEVIESRPPDVMKYRFVASAMAQLHLFDEAINVYKEAVRKFKGQEIMYRDIATLYRSQLNYSEAGKYLLKYYNHYKKRYNDVYMQVMYIIADKEALPPLIKEFEKYLADNHDKKISELLGGLYLRNDNIDKAYDIYHALYRQDKNINHLKNFSREAELKKAYHYAVKAYKEILSSNPPEQTALEVKFDLAKNYYLLAVQENYNDYVERSLGILEELSANNKLVAYKNRAMELRGDIYLNYFNDLDRALREYKQTVKIENNRRKKERIFFKMAEVYFLKNNLQQAENIYNKIKDKQNIAYALYQKGNLEYYRGRFTQAHTLYDRALSKTGIRDSLSNNILSQIMMLDQFAEDSTSLAQFGNAERLAKQGRKSQAAEKYYNLFLKKKAIGALAGIKGARLMAQIGKTKEAVNLLQAFTELYPDADNIDQAWFLLGKYNEALKKYNDALTAYQKILDDFPESFYLDRARENARAVTRLNEKAVNKSKQ